MAASTSMGGGGHCFVFFQSGTGKELCQQVPGPRERTKGLPPLGVPAFSRGFIESGQEFGT